MEDALGPVTERTRESTVRKMAALALSVAPAGNVNVLKDGIWVRFGDSGNLHVYSALGIVEASRDAVLDKGLRIAEAFRRAGFAMHEVYVRAPCP